MLTRPNQRLPGQQSKAHAYTVNNQWLYHFGSVRLESRLDNVEDPVDCNGRLQLNGSIRLVPLTSRRLDAIDWIHGQSNTESRPEGEHSAQSRFFS